MKYVCTAVCYFSKWVEAEALPNKKAVTVAKFLYHLLCRYGVADIHITDQGSEFNNSIHGEFYKLTKTAHTVTSAYHPQSNGMVECQNHTTEGTIKKFCLNNKENWLPCLDGVLFSVRCAQHCSTNVSPYRAVYGFKPTMPFESNYESQLSGDFHDEGEDSTDQTPHEPCAKFEEDMEEMDPTETFEYMENIRDCISQKIVNSNPKAEVHYVRNCNKRHEIPVSDPFQVGANVWKFNAKDAQWKEKNKPNWHGPYMITEVCKEVLTDSMTSMLTI